MIQVKFFPCNPFGELCYVAWDDESCHCVIVDPGMCSDAEWLKVHHFLADHQLEPDYILITHSHTDHVMGTGYVKREYPDVPICGSVEDQNHLPPVAEQNQMFGVDVLTHHVPINRDLMEDDTLLLPALAQAGMKQHRIRVIDCPGHSHHGLCYYFEDDAVLFSGDVLFAGSVGRSDFGMAMGGNGRLLLEGIAQKLFALPAEVKVYPGHGMYTTIGYERETNPYV